MIGAIYRLLDIRPTTRSELNSNLMDNRNIHLKIKNLLRPIYHKYRLRKIKNRFLVRGKVKYFCIGRNKTGTTSLKKAFEDLGYIVGNQREAEHLYDRFYFKHEFEPIIRYCRSAQVFQDVPFSCPETYKHLDIAFPNSKFILTIRDSSEQWYRSLCKFHAKRFSGDPNRPPNYTEMLNSDFIRPGYKTNMLKLYGTSKEDPYNAEILKAHYEWHNAQIIEYFKNRPNDLLVINISDPNAYKQFCDFIHEKPLYSQFPWENKT